MIANIRILTLIIATSVLASGVIAYGFSGSYMTLDKSNIQSVPLTTNGIRDSPAPVDTVTITVRDINGNVKEQQTHNVVTTAGAVWYCIQQNRCQTQIATPSVVYTGATVPTWWVQFNNGTLFRGFAASDCKVSGTSLAGNISGTRCVVATAATGQYNTGGSGGIPTVGAFGSTTAALVQPSSGATFTDTTNNFASTNGGTACTTLGYGTCSYTETTPALTAANGKVSGINGLALASGTGLTTTAGPIIVAEASITSLTLNVGDTITVTWTITT